MIALDLAVHRHNLGREAKDCADPFMTVICSTMAQLKHSVELGFMSEDAIKKMGYKELIYQGLYGKALFTRAELWEADQEQDEDRKKSTFESVVLPGRCKNLRAISSPSRMAVLACKIMNNCQLHPLI